MLQSGSLAHHQSVITKGINGTTARRDLLDERCVGSIDAQAAFLCPNRNRESGPSSGPQRPPRLTFHEHSFYFNHAALIRTDDLTCANDGFRRDRVDVMSGRQAGVTSSESACIRQSPICSASMNAFNASRTASSQLSAAHGITRCAMRRSRPTELVTVL